MKNYYYYSEMGCIKIGNENFSSLLLNGKGEGSFWIHVCNKEELKRINKKEFIALLSGKNINFYVSEKNKHPILNLPKGKYEIYKEKGDIYVCEKTDTQIS